MNMKYAMLALLSAGVINAACSAPAEAPKPEPLVRPDTHAAYLKDNASGYDWFANAADGYGGVPLILRVSKLGFGAEPRF